MEIVLHTIALLALVLGTAFSVIGVLGFVRLPDVYTRLHATGKVSVFGVVLLLVAAVCLGTAGLGRSLLLIAFLVFAGPATSHMIAAAAYRLRIPPEQLRRDDLAALWKSDPPAKKRR